VIFFGSAKLSVTSLPRYKPASTSPSMDVLTKLFCEQAYLGESKRKTFGWMKNLGCKRENLWFPYFYGLKYPTCPAKIEI